MKTGLENYYAAIDREDGMEENEKKKFDKRFMDCEKKLHFPIEENEFIKIKKEYDEIVKDFNNAR